MLSGAARRVSLISLLVMCALVLLVFIWQIISFKNKSLIPASGAVYYEYLPGTSVSKFAVDLAQMGVLRHPKWFVLLTRIEGKSTTLQAGEYLFPAKASNGEVLNMLAKGLVIQHPFTIVEGWTFNQIQQAIQDDPYLTQMIAIQPVTQVMNTLGVPSIPSPEGVFYPNTYFFAKGSTDKSILQKAYLSMRKILDSEWETRASNLPFQTPYQALIVASLIEKETAVASEKPLVAGVIALRLQKGMPLQIDPTVIYGMGATYQGNITRKGLQTDTPYNTYTRSGLPPTPIAMPSQASIHAALHPSLQGYLYFVAKGDGTHQFSKTLAEQNFAVRQYQLNQKK